MEGFTAEHMQRFLKTESGTGKFTKEYSDLYFITMLPSQLIRDPYISHAVINMFF